MEAEQSPSGQLYRPEMEAEVTDQPFCLADQFVKGFIGFFRQGVLGTSLFC